MARVQGALGRLAQRLVIPPIIEENSVGAMLDRRVWIIHNQGERIGLHPNTQIDLYIIKGTVDDSAASGCRSLPPEGNGRKEHTLDLLRVTFA